MIENRYLLQIGRDIATETGARLIEAGKAHSLGKEEAKRGASGDIVKLGDRIAEETVNELLPSYLGGVIEGIILISEECGIRRFPPGSDLQGDSIFVILDPVDGSNNLRDRPTPCPSVATSIAIGQVLNIRSGYKNDFELVDAAVIRDVFSKRSYCAVRGRNSRVDGFGDIKTSDIKKVHKSIIGVDLDSSRVSSYRKPDIVQSVEWILKEAKCIRRIGSSALDFCKVASGEYDAFLSLGKRMGFYDIAGTKLLIEEAGGTMEIRQVSGPKKHILKELIFDSNIGLLKDVRFNVKATGCKELLDDINSKRGKGAL